MRRRRFIASGLATLAALAGCVGRERAPAAGDATTTRNRWKPAPTASGPATHQEKSGADDTATPGDGSFEGGRTWKARKAQVAASAPDAGASVQFELVVASPQRCGRTCRKLRAALSNTGSADAHDVAVRTELLTGGDVLRERRDAIGDLPAGATYRATERVELGVFEAVRVKRNGALAVKQVVTSTERREVFRDHIEV